MLQAVASATFTIGGRPVEVHAIQSGWVTVKRCHHTGCLPEWTPVPLRFVAILADRRFAEPLPIWSYVVVHPEGVFVVDTGVEPGYNDPSTWEGHERERRFVHSFIKVEVAEHETVPARMSELGMASGDVKALVLTHQHVDHTGTVPAFPTADVWTTEVEDSNAMKIGALQWRWRGPVTRIRHVDREGRSGELGPTVDLTSDGTLQAIHTAGHTDGSLSVVLHADQGEVWFIGDIHRDPHHRRRPGRLPGREPGRYRLVVSRACPWANRAIIVRRLLGLEDVLSMGGRRPDPRRPQLDLRPRSRRAWTRCSGSSGCRRPTSPGSPTTRRASPSRRWSTSRPAQVVTNDFPQITLDLSTEWREHHRDGAPTCTPRTCATRSTRSWTLVYRDVNNGVYRCGFAGSQEAYEEAYHRLFDRLDWLSERLSRPALPRGRHHHRGRRPAVHHAGPLRRRLPRPLQVQPAQAHRDAGAVGLRPRPVPDPGLRRHDRLRPHQAALLRGAPDINPTGIVPLGPDLSWATDWPNPATWRVTGGRRASSRQRVR
jgi:N-acyl homoserine lactone hydrolase